ncbi:MAG: ATP-binding protein [Nocardioidaceae bacterium]
MRSWWLRRSLRLRLTLAASVAITCVLVVGAGLLIWRVHTSLLADLDTAAARQALAAATGISTGGRPVLPAGGEGDMALQVVGPRGRVVASSLNIDGEPRIFSFATSAPFAAPPTVLTAYDVPLGDNGSYRVATLAAAGPDGRRYLVYVGLPMGPVNRTVTTMVAALAGGVPVLAGVLVGVTWLLVGRALRPVEVLRRQAASFTVSDLGRRVDVPSTGDELSRLGVTLNDLLAQLDSSLQQQRQFVADAAHELRSPIASVLAQLEVAGAEDGGALGHAPEALVAEVRRLSCLVDDLLALARLDAQPKLRTAPVDLDDVVVTEVAVLRARTSVAVDTSAVSAARVSGDAGMLHRVVRNLLDNASRYARSRIAVGLLTDGATVVLTVADDGPGIPQAYRRRVFDRFTRLDEARHRDAGGVGLGLAIVRDVVAAHHGEVSAEDNLPGTRFVVRMPAAEPTS